MTKSLLVGFNEFFDWRLNPARITVETIRSDAAFAAEVGLIGEVLPPSSRGLSQFACASRLAKSGNEH